MTRLGNHAENTHNIHFDELAKQTKKRKNNRNNLSNKIAIKFCETIKVL